MSFSPVDFTPKSAIYKNRRCHGVRVSLIDRSALDVASLGIEIIGALRKIHPRDFLIDGTLGLIGSHEVLQSLADGLDPKAIVPKWQGQLSAFLEQRSKYLLY